MNLEKLMDDNYAAFFMLNNNYVDKKSSEINLFVDVTNKIFKYVKKLLLHFFIFIKHFPYSKNYSNKIIFYTISTNNYDSLFPVYKALEKDSIIISSDYRLANKAVLLPMIIPLIISIFFIPLLIINTVYTNLKIRKRILLYLDDILLSMGFNYFVKHYLKILNPTAIIFSHDHTFYARSLIKSAEAINIPCFYIQHSAITNNFPPINSSYALLEGKDSLKKYYPNGHPKDQVFLIGSPKFDKHLNHINNKTIADKIGICSTSSMDKNQVIRLIDEIKNKIDSNKIYFRPHPAEMINNKYNDYQSFNDFRYSNPLHEDSYNFLRNIDVVITGNSSILLEAAMMNVYPILWRDSKSITKYNDDPADKYGFIKNGLAVPCDSISEIIDCLDKVKMKKPDIRANASFYIENINTDWDGQSVDYAATIIKNNI